MIEINSNELEDIIEIENEVFNYPWTRQIFCEELNNKFTQASFIKDNNKIIGYGFITILYENADIDNIAVSNKYQGKGYGNKLLNELIEIAKENKVENILLEVRISNNRAINLYKKNGFEIIRIIKSYYQDNYEDAYQMIKHLEVE